MAAWIEVQLSSLIAVDLAIKNSISQEAFLTGVFQYITAVGSAAYLGLLALILLVMARRNRQIKPAVTLAGGLMFVYLAVHVIKEIVQRTRPLGQVFTWAPGYSFPSGHSACSMFVYGFLIYWVFGQKWPPIYKYLSAAVLGLLIALIGFSRIYLNAHYVSDVLAGYILGFIGILVCIKVLRSWESH